MHIMINGTHQVSQNQLVMLISKSTFTPAISNALIVDINVNTCYSE
jgi:hypothetical protein